MVDGVIVLYEQNETNFTSNGLGYLSDAIECTVSEELNGEYELEMEYPVDGIRYSEIQHRRILYVKPNPYEDPQPFRIYNINRPIDGRVEINARHISYDLSGYTVSESEDKNIPFSTSPKMFCEKISSAMTELNSGMPSFTFWTNSVEEYDSETYTEEGDELKEKHWIYIDTPSSVRSLIGQFTEKYKGEFKFDKYTVKFYGPVSGQSEDDKHYRGTDSGVVLRYGKNLTDLMQEEDSDKGMYTHLYPYWSGTVNTTNTDHESNESSSHSEEKVVTMTNKLYPILDHDVGYKRVLIYEVNSDWNEKHPNNTNDATPWPSEEDFEELCKEYIKNNELGVPKITLTASFVQLSRSAEYEDLKPLEKVLLGDTVSVLWEDLGVNSTLKCTSTEYDALTDSYKSITLGNDANASISSTVAATSSGLSGVTSSMSDKVSKEEFYNQTYDTALSTTSTNAVQNKVVTSKFNEMKRCCNEVKGDIEYLKEFVSSAGGTLSYGTDIPTGGKDGDGYIQVAQSSGTNPITLSVGNNTGNWAVNDFTASNKKYSFNITGIGNPSLDIANIDAVNLTPNHEYRVNFAAKMSSNATYYNNGAFTFGVNVAEFNSLINIGNNNITRGTYDSSRRYQSFYEDNTTHNYSFTFRTGANEDKVSLSFSFHDVQDDNQVTLDVTNFTVVDTSSGDNEIIDLWFKIDGEWLVYSNESAFTYGYSLPTGGSDGDAYVQITSTPKDPRAVVSESTVHNNFEVSNFTQSGTKYSFDISGTVDADQINYALVNVDNLRSGSEYKVKMRLSHDVPTASLDRSHTGRDSGWRKAFGLFIGAKNNLKTEYVDDQSSGNWFLNNAGLNEVRGWEDEIRNVGPSACYQPQMQYQGFYKDVSDREYDFYFTASGTSASFGFVFDDCLDETTCNMSIVDMEVIYVGSPKIPVNWGGVGSVFANATWNDNWMRQQGISDNTSNSAWTNWGGGNNYAPEPIICFAFNQATMMDRIRLNVWEGPDYDDLPDVTRTLYIEASTDDKAWNAEDKEWVNVLPGNTSVDIPYPWNHIDHVYFNINKGTYHDIRVRFVSPAESGKLEALQCYFIEEQIPDNHVKDLFFKCDGEWLVYPRDDQGDEPVFTYGSEDPDENTEGDIYAKLTDDAIDSISYKVNDTWLLGPSGGSGGGSGFTKTLLWDSGNDEGTGAQKGTVYTLSDNLSKYDMVYVEYGTYIDRSQHGQVQAGIPILPRYFDVTSSLLSGYDQGMADYYQRYCYIRFTDTTFEITRQGCPGESSGYEPRPYKIYGIKFSGGSGGGSERTDLYDATGDLPTPTAGTNNVDREYLLNDNINNYDAIMVSAAMYVYGTEIEQCASVCVEKDLYYLPASSSDIHFSHMLNGTTTNSFRRLCFGFNSSGTKILTRASRSDSGLEPMLLKVYGYKYGDSGGGSEQTDLLYLASGTTAPNTITLAHPYTDYEKLYISIYAVDSGSSDKFLIESTPFVADLEVNLRIGGCSDIGYVWYSLTNATTLTKLGAYQEYHIKSIRGIGSSSS